MAVKYKHNYGMTPLHYAKESGRSSKVINILEELMKKSDYDMKNRIDIPKIVAIHGLNNVRRIYTIQWLLMNSPVRINGAYVQ
jgi:hypothetical protein